MTYKLQNWHNKQPGYPWRLFGFASLKKVCRIAKLFDNYLLTMGKVSHKFI